MAPVIEMIDHQTLHVRSLCQPVVPDRRHFISSQAAEQASSWFHHWPENHCTHRLHDAETLSICQTHLVTAHPAMLIYDALFPAARGATPLLQSLLNHCPDYREAWGVHSGPFSLQSITQLSSHYILPGFRLVYVHDSLRRLSPSSIQQEVTLNILIYHLRDNA